MSQSHAWRRTGVDGHRVEAATAAARGSHRRSSEYCRSRAGDRGYCRPHTGSPWRPTIGPAETCIGPKPNCGKNTRVDGASLNVGSGHGLFNGSDHVLQCCAPRARMPLCMLFRTYKTPSAVTPVPKGFSVDPVAAEFTFQVAYVDMFAPAIVNVRDIYRNRFFYLQVAGGQRVHCSDPHAAQRPQRPKQATAEQAVAEWPAIGTGKQQPRSTMRCVFAFVPRVAELLEHFCRLATERS